jgi:hypothetical protein
MGLGRVVEVRVGGRGFIKWTYSDEFDAAKATIQNHKKKGRRVKAGSNCQTQSKAREARRFTARMCKGMTGRRCGCRAAPLENRDLWEL